MTLQLKPYSITSYSLFISRLFIFLVSSYYTLINSTTIIIWEIFRLHNSIIYFPVILDPKGLLFSSVVLFISANVIKFAETYMEGNHFDARFIILVLIFVFSINILIFFPHIITLLLGWDGLGLTRFILVIYYQNSKSLGAGIITAITNRIGDAILLLAIGWTLNINHWSIINMWSTQINNIIIASLLIAAITKRAQIPFSSWLPAAIAAPTPVSALVHSSTLVTAGVFLLIRFYYFLTEIKHFSTALLLISSLTILIAGLSALTECDLKKIIALSTLSQLGVMMARLGLGSPNLAFFHLITHALFKALLFICAGSIIHFHAHGQDLRTVGSLINQLPFTISTLLIANISLCGLPFLSGFYSKDLILEFSIFNPINWIIFILLITATICTMAYSLRLTINALWAPHNRAPTHQINNNDTNILIPAGILGIGAIWAGTIIRWQILPLAQEIFLPIHIKILPLLVTIFGAYLLLHFNLTHTVINSIWIKKSLTHDASCSIWFMSPLSTQNILPLPINISHLLQKSLDQGWIEILSAQGTFTSLSSASKKLQPIQKNHIITILHFIIISTLIVSLLVLFTFWKSSLYLKHNFEAVNKVITPFFKC